MNDNVQIRISGRYKIDSLIAETKQSQIFEATNIHTKEKVAIKLEEKDTKKPLLTSEAKKLRELQGGIFIPTYLTSGGEGDFNFLVVELLGKSLEDYVKICKGSFSLKTSLMVAEQLIQALEFIHDRGIIHRHIKPGNICLGGESNFFHVNLVDFGFSKYYLVDKTSHIPMQDGLVFIGEIVYASMRNHAGKEQSRRDDFESLIYMILHFLTGSLPWIAALEDKGLGFEEKRKAVFDLKKEFGESPYWDTALIKVSNDDDEELMNIPPELKEFYKEIVSLGFEEKPDYTKYRRILKEILVKNYLEYDYIYDWFLIPVSEIVNEDLDLLEDFSKNDYEIKFQEEKELKELMEEYEEDPGLIDFKLKEVKRKNEKFDESGTNKKWSKKKKIIVKVDNVRISKVEKITKRDAKARKKKEKDCNLI